MRDTPRKARPASRKPGGVTNQMHIKTVTSPPWPSHRITAKHLDILANAHRSGVFCKSRQCRYNHVKQFGLWNAVLTTLPPAAIGSQQIRSNTRSPYRLTLATTQMTGTKWWMNTVYLSLSIGSRIVLLITSWSGCFPPDWWLPETRKLAQTATYRVSSAFSRDI